MYAFFSKLQPFALNAVRIMVGLAFWSHGAQKLFAWFGREEPVALMTRFGAAGIIEFFAGGLVVLGLFHRPAAFLISGEMAVTYWWMHVARRGDLWWWANRGELPLVYCFVFLLIAAFGGGDFSIDGWLAKRKRQAG
jgi:putative oxidoreductase